MVKATPKGKEGEDKTVAQQKREKYGRKKRWINLMSIAGAILALFDATTHMLAVNVLSKAYTNYNGYLTDNVTDTPVCKYSEQEDKFTNMTGDETALCSALAGSNVTDPKENRQCNLNTVLISGTARGNGSYTKGAWLDNIAKSAAQNIDGEMVKLAEGGNMIKSKDQIKRHYGLQPDKDEEYFIHTEHFTKRVKTLNASRFAQVACLIATLILTSWFLYQLVGKHMARVALLKKELLPAELVQEEILIERLYTDPPEMPFDDDAPKAAPTYWVAFRSLESAEHKVEKKKPKRRCAKCGSTLGPDDDACPLCSDDMDDLKKVENLSRKEKVEEYMWSFCRAAEVRLAIMIVADMPALIVYVLYMSSVDDSSGLHCAVEASAGELGTFGVTYNEDVAIICCAGGFISVFLLFFQVVYIESMAKKEDRAFAWSKKYEELEERSICVGMDIQMSIIMIPFSIAPVLVTLLLTGAKDILNMSDYWWVVAGVFGIPWIGICAVFLLGLLDFCGLIDSCEGGADLAGGAGDGAADAADGCCGDCGDCFDCCGEGGGAAGEAGEGCCEAIGECCGCVGDCITSCVECCF